MWLKVGFPLLIHCEHCLNSSFVCVWDTLYICMDTPWWIPVCRWQILCIPLQLLTHTHMHARKSAKATCGSSARKGLRPRNNSQRGTKVRSVWAGRPPRVPHLVQLDLFWSGSDTSQRLSSCRFHHNVRHFSLQGRKIRGSSTLTLSPLCVLNTGVTLATSLDTGRGDWKYCCYFSAHMSLLVRQYCWHRSACSFWETQRTQPQQGVQSHKTGGGESCTFVFRLNLMCYLSKPVQNSGQAGAPGCSL